MSLDQLQQLLMWCSIINMGLLVFSLAMITSMHGFICRLHGKIFRVSEESVGNALYWFFGIWKICIFLFNVVPWLALYLVD